jgi:hypothetical protein
MSRAPFLVIDGRLYRWKDILDLRRAQLAATGAAEASQLAPFATLHDDRRPPAERTAAGRYLHPSFIWLIKTDWDLRGSNLRHRAKRPRCHPP